MTAQPGMSLGQATMVSCWRALADTAFGPGRIVETPLAIAAIFPEFVYLNNAVLTAGVDSADAAAQDAAALYAEAGVPGWALWVASPATTFGAAPDQVPQVGALQRDVTTIAMQRDLTGELRRDARVRTVSDTAFRRLVMEEHVPFGHLGAPDPAPEFTAWTLVVDGDPVATAHAHWHDTDCGIYAVGTLAAWRRRGLARALVEHILADARDAGMRTATLQSTPMGLPLYESLGFEALGRYEEWLHAPTSDTAAVGNP